MLPPASAAAAEATGVRRRVAMEWEDFQRVSTITNLVGERRGRGIMKIWREGGRGEMGDGGREGGRRARGR